MIKFNEILLSSSSSLTQKLMPVDPTLLTPTPTGASPTALADALKAAVIEGMKASMPVGGTPPVETQEEIDKKAAALAAATTTTTATVVKQQVIDQKDINLTVRAMIADAKGNTTDDRILTIDDLIDIIVQANLNTDTEFKQFFQSRKTDKKKKGVTKNAIVTAMSNDKRASGILEQIAYGIIVNGISAADSWTQVKAGTYHKDVYDDRILKGTGRKRKKTAQNKAHVDLSEISKILQKYN